MNIKNTLYVTNRKSWRAWLKKHHKKEKEIWLVYYKKHSHKTRIPYNEAVEEALCFGWIDSTVKTIDQDSYAQRYSPRSKNSQWSEMNKERARRLIKQGKMMAAGFERLTGVLPKKEKKLNIPKDIKKALQQDQEIWKHFMKFPESYKRIRIGWIDAARTRPKIFNQRLSYFLKMTKRNKRFGMVQ